MPVPTPLSNNAVIDVDRQAIDPILCLVRAYDRAIRACESFDYDGAHSAISILRGALELDTPAAHSFDALYAWCEDAVDTHDYMGAAQCLRTLRDAWRTATSAGFRVRADLPVC